MDRLPRMNIVATLDHNGEAQARRDFCDDGEYCWSDHALMLIAERDAEIERLHREIHKAAAAIQAIDVLMLEGYQVRRHARLIVLEILQP